MFYEPKDGHGLSKNPFNSLVVPRPIGWISSVDKNGVVNLAPYSFFNATSYSPPTVMFSAGKGQVEDDGRKDSLRNIIETGEFVHNFTNWDTREAMNESSATTSMDVDEMAMVGLTLRIRVVPPVRTSRMTASRLRSATTGLTKMAMEMRMPWTPSAEPMAPNTTRKSRSIRLSV